MFFTSITFVQETDNLIYLQNVLIQIKIKEYKSKIFALEKLEYPTKSPCRYTLYNLQSTKQEFIPC